MLKLIFHTNIIRAKQLLALQLNFSTIALLSGILRCYGRRFQPAKVWPALSGDL